MSGWGNNMGPRVPMGLIHKESNLLQTDPLQKPTQRQSMPIHLPQVSPLHEFDEWDEESYSQAFRLYSIIEQLQESINTRIQNNFQVEEGIQELNALKEKNQALFEYYDQLRKECDQNNQERMNQESISTFETE